MGGHRVSDDPADRCAVLGVRHHGPGSARSVAAELDRLRPATVLIEGPADADPLLALAAAPGMAPPVALLAYAPDAPRLSSFWPYAVFSPEWQAITWAARHEVPVRFCDLPASAVLALREEEPGIPPDAEERLLSLDPIGEMAAAAGYDDPERWWDDLVESRMDGRSPFAALAEAMAELRDAEQQIALENGARAGTATPREQRREAHMRQVLRTALRETAGTVAVVCGAWHAPALAGPLPPAARDAALLRGMPRRKVALAWVPWTHSRLAAASGYGAGITSPGWYHHLFTAPDKTIERWMTRVAGVLREHDLPVSSAHVIEAVRLARALATLRGRPLAGLAEVTEATKAVMCDGGDVAAAFVTRELVAGELLGSVPDDAPPVPLDADLRARARSLKLRIEPLDKTLALDLRTDLDRARSAFLHQLTALGIGWGTVTEDLVKATGTWHETWSLRWRPELAVDIIDAAVWGTTVPDAATAAIIDTAANAADLTSVTAAVELVLVAGLSDALAPVLRALDAQAAADSDVADLMSAVPPLVRAARYGTVRGTDTASLAAVVGALTVRACAGLPAAVGGLADDAAARLRSAIDGMHTALELFTPGGTTLFTPGGRPPVDPRQRGETPLSPPSPGEPAQNAGPRDIPPPGLGTTPQNAGPRDIPSPGLRLWLAVLGSVAGRRDVHGLVAGRVTRLLADAGVVPWPEAAVRLRAALSVGATAMDKAAWAEGFLSGGGLLLVHDRDLLGVLDGWVASLDEEDFLDALPLLRRTFGEFSAPERAAIGSAAGQLSGSHGAGVGEPDAGPDDIDASRAAGALATVALILGGSR
jgi:Family of unknown function (DUF5682)